MYTVQQLRDDEHSSKNVPARGSHYRKAKRILFAFLFALVTLTMPHIAFADIRITEIAWMGTEDSQYGEWIELYNLGNEEVSLADWKLYQDGGGTLVITLSKSIPAKGYMVIERTTASSPDPLPNISDEAGIFGGGGLSNSGEHVVLKDKDGTTVYALNASAGWPAGDSKTKETMQWNGGAWVTAKGTPKSAYTSFVGSTPLEDEGTSATVVAPQTKKFTPTITLSYPKDAYTGVPLEFTPTVVQEYGNPSRGLLVWNFGDGTTMRQIEFEPVRHTYRYRGTYTIALAYYVSPHDVKPSLTKNFVIEITEPSIVLRFVDRNAIEIKNTTDDTVDLSGWRFLTSRGAIEIPNMTILASAATITIPAHVLGIQYAADMVLTTPNGVLVTQEKQEEGNAEKKDESLKTLQASQKRTLETDSVGDVVFIRPETLETEDENTGQLGELLVAEAQGAVDDAPLKNQNRTKTIVFGAVMAIVIGLFILLERFMARQE